MDDQYRSEAGPLSDAWKAELDRREAEFQRGEVELIDNDEAFALLRGDGIDRAWMEEAKRRYEAVRSGKARTLSHEDVVARLEARFA